MEKGGDIKKREPPGELEPVLSSTLGSLTVNWRPWQRGLTARVPVLRLSLMMMMDGKKRKGVLLRKRRGAPLWLILPER